MKVIQTPLVGVLLIEPDCFADHRGFFLESFQRPRYAESGITDDFVQDNHTRSVKGVLRGMHYQMRWPQAQIISVIRGHILDVVVDIRPGSANFGRWFGAELSDNGIRQIYMAPGFAHGFYVLSDMVDVHYKVSRTYNHGDEAGLSWNDPDIGIKWPTTEPIMLKRDFTYPRLREIPPDRLPHLETLDPYRP